MRLLIRLFVVLAVLWCGWWWLAATLVDRGIADWLEARRADGWDANVQQTDISGFPVQIATRLQNLAVRDPAGGAVTADSITLSFPAYWPGDVTLTLPDTPVRFDTPVGAYFLRTQEGVASVNLHPGPALELERLLATAGPWQVNDIGGNLLGAESLRAAFAQKDDAPQTYTLLLDATDFAPGDVIRSRLALPPEWPRVFETFTADLDLRFDRPLDRQSLNGTRPQVTAVDIRQIDLMWGDLGFAATGTVGIDEGGVPDGALALRLSNWRQIMEQAELAGAVTPQQRGQAEVILNALANMGGTTETLALDVRFEQGEMFLGPIRLGPAPRLRRN